MATRALSMHMSELSLHGRRFTCQASVTCTGGVWRSLDRHRHWPGGRRPRNDGDAAQRSSFAGVKDFLGMHRSTSRAQKSDVAALRIQNHAARSGRGMCLAHCYKFHDWLFVCPFFLVTWLSQKASLWRKKRQHVVTVFAPARFFVNVSLFS